MDFELKRSKLKVKIYDKELDVKKPSVGDIDILEKELKANPGESLDIMKKYLERFGFNQEITSQLEMEHFLDLVQFLNGAKKKN